MGFTSCPLVSAHGIARVFGVTLELAKKQLIKRTADADTNNFGISKATAKAKGK